MNLRCGSLRNRVLAIALAAAAFMAPGAKAQDIAVSAAVWHFPGWPGGFASAGATLGLGPRLELGASFIPRITPEAFDDIIAESHLGLSLVGPRIAAYGPAGYVNTILDAGMMLAWHNLVSGSPAQTTSVFLRLTPLAIGNSYYGRRDRLLSIGLSRDFDTGALSLFVNILSTDIYIASGTKAH